jgi:DNA-binding transcriptional ArsR family regulator
MSAPSDVLVQWLRAVGEPSRLRLLALCAEVALSVSDLAQALKQSEPRVSRHLKILCEAGLLERRRQGQWVHYRIASTADAASFVRGLIAQLDRRDPQMQADRAAVRSAQAVQAATPGSGSRLGRALAGFVREGGLASSGTVLLVGLMHPELLESAAGGSRRLTALASSRRAAQSARSFAEQRSFRCQVLQTSSPQGPQAADLASAGSSFDAVLLDHPLDQPQESGETLIELLKEARRLLAPGGRLWLFVPYESFEGARGRVVEHPLARLRRLLASAGLRCERLGPLEAEGEHVLAALASAAADEAGKRAPAAGVTS